MIFVHGTCKKNWENIKKDGFIKPRGNQAGSWFTNIDGNKHLIYLFNEASFVAHKNDSIHGYKSAIANGDDTVVILYISLHHLDESLLRVDENYIDMMTRGHYDNCPVDNRVQQRELALYDTRWRESLNTINMCAYAGYIPVEAVIDTREYKIEDSVWHKPDFVSYISETSNTVFDLHLSHCNNVSMTMPELSVEKYIRIWQDNDPIKDISLVHNMLDAMEILKTQINYE